MSTLTDQEVYDKLLIARDDFITSGKVTQKSWVTKAGDTIFVRSMRHLEQGIKTLDGVK